MGKKQKKDRYESGQRPWRDVSTFAGGPGRVWTLWASVILLVGIVAVAVVVVLRPADGPGVDGAPRPESSSTSTPEGDVDADEGEGLCPEVSVDESATTPPGDLEWVSVYGNSWPVSHSVGPKVDVDGLGHCFDRSPIGAALAAVNLYTSLSAADVDTAHRILGTQYVQNAGVPAAIEQIDEFFVEQPPQTRPLPRVLGYQVMHFDEDRAIVLLAESWPTAAQYMGVYVTVVWAGGDWKVQLADDGGTSVNGRITVDPDGFTRWVDAP